jgi:hypothetical protein
MNLDTVDTQSLRDANPAVYEAWSQGRVRPYWLTHARLAGDRTLKDLEEDMTPSALQVEAGLVYPTWGFLCRFAVWAGADLGQLVGVPDPGAPIPVAAVQESALNSILEEDSQEDLAGIEAGLRVRYHPAAIAHTLAHTPEPGGRFPYAEFQAGLGKVVFASMRGIGTQMAAGISREQVVADLDAGVAPETRILRARWAGELSPLHHALAQQPPRIDELLMFSAVSWVDPTIRLTFAASTVPEEPSTVLVSIAGHHEHHRRVPLPYDEATLWAPVLFNDSQLPHVIYHGTTSGIQGPDAPIGLLTTESFTYTHPAMPAPSRPHGPHIEASTYPAGGARGS